MERQRKTVVHGDMAKVQDILLWRCPCESQHYVPWIHTRTLYTASVILGVRWGFFVSSVSSASVSCLATLDEAQFPQMYKTFLLAQGLFPLALEGVLGTHLPRASSF